LWIEFLEFGCNFIGVIPVVEQNRRSLAIASRSLSHPIRIKNNLELSRRHLDAMKQAKEKLGFRSLKSSD